MKRSNSWLLSTALFLFGAAPSLEAQRNIPRDATVYIEEMEGDLDGYIRAEFIKKKVPLKVVLDIEAAAFVLTGSATEEGNRSWHEGWLTMEKDHNIGNAMLVRKETSELLWAGEAGDRSWFWGALKRGGPRKVAERLVDNLKNHIMKD